MASEIDVAHDILLEQASSAPRENRPALLDWAHTIYIDALSLLHLCSGDGDGRGGSIYEYRNEHGGSGSGWTNEFVLTLSSMEGGEPSTRGLGDGLGYGGGNAAGGYESDGGYESSPFVSITGDF